MKNYIFNYHNEIRIIFFLIFLFIFLALQYFFPQKNITKNMSIRWFNNFSLFLLNTILIKIILPFIAVTFSIYVTQNNFGLFNFIEVNNLISLFVSLILFDLTIYFQHYMFHKNSILWKFHRVHHADTDLDVSTGLRFHPIEIFVSLLIKFIFISIIGPPVIAVLIFEILLNTSSMFNHSNISISEKIDLLLRKFVVTPNMHRLHHSNKIIEQNKNFGFNLSIWDYIFKTYKYKNIKKLNNITIGVKELNSKKDLWIHKILIQPFK